MNNRNAVNTLKDVIRAPFAFPGGYEKVLVTTDGACICHKCAKSEYRNILHSTRGAYNDGWQVDGVFLAEETDGELFCDHCGTDINADD